MSQDLAIGAGLADVPGDDLVAQLHGTEELAFAAHEELFRRNRGLFLTCATKWINRKQAKTDALQESKEAAWDNRQQFTIGGEKAWRSWFKTILLHNAIKRSQRGKRSSNLGDGSDAVPGRRSATDIELKDLIETLHSQLDDDDRELLRLRFSESLLLVELASHFDVSIATISNRLNTVLTRLRTIMRRPSIGG